MAERIQRKRTRGWRMRSDTRAITERIIAALRAADLPLSTNQVCERAGRYLDVHHECSDWHHEEAWSDPYYDLVACDGRRHILSVSLRVGQRGYMILRRLERDGLVTRDRFDGQRDVHWRWTGPPIDDRLADLEASWEASQ